MLYPCNYRIVLTLMFIALLTACDNLPELQSPQKLSLHGVVEGLTGDGLRVEVNGGTNTQISDNGNFSINAEYYDETHYQIIVVTQPSDPSQTCAIENYRGTFSGNDVSDIQISCITDAHPIPIEVTGLIGSGFIIQNNEKDNLSITNDGQFSFATPLNIDETFNISIQSQPTNPTQVCQATFPVGKVNGNGVEPIKIQCSARYALNINVKGLLGSGFILSNNNSDKLPVSADGLYELSVADNSSYQLSIETSPSNPTQFCEIANGRGDISGSDSSIINVNCEAAQRIGGQIDGLTEGSELVLQTSEGNTFSVNENGEFNFTLPPERNYDITVVSQPNAYQTCYVTNGNGVVGNDNISDIQITCMPQKLPIGVDVKGLQATGLILNNNAADDLVIDQAGAYIFSSRLAQNSPYQVSILQQPSEGYICSVENGTGIIKVDQPTIIVNCSISNFSISGTVSEMVGDALVLQNNAGENFSVQDKTAFNFRVLNNTGYDIQVIQQPSPTEVCIVNNGKGIIENTNITNIQIACSTPTYEVQVNAIGLQGVTVTLQNNAGDDLSITADGSYRFANTLLNSQPYKVSILNTTSPADEVCQITQASGNINQTDVTNITVTCDLFYSITGSVNGLIGTELVLQNNAANKIALNEDGDFSFTVDNLSDYQISILTAPSATESCTVINGSGTINSASINNVSLVCTEPRYTINVNVTGLQGDGIVLQNNGSDNLSIDENGVFQISSQQTNTSVYKVTMLTPSSSSQETCRLENTSGNINWSNVTNINLHCSPTFLIGGTVSNLAGSGLVLSNSLDESITLTANGNFSFPARVLSGESYDIRIVTQPTNLNQTCQITNSTGNITDDDIRDISVSCKTHEYPLSINLAQTDVGTVILQNNAGDDLTVNAEGIHIFSTSVTDGSAYDIQVSTQPTGDYAICQLNNGTGVVAGQAVELALSCIKKPKFSSVEALSKTVDLTWDNTLADSHHVYYSHVKGFDPENYSAVPGGTLLSNVTSPLTVSNLTNKQPYYFVLAAIHGTTTLQSTERGIKPNHLVFDSSINSMQANAATGTVYIGGTFNKVKRYTGSGVITDLAGNINPVYPYINDNVYSAIADGTGGWYVGGDFYDVAGTELNYLIRIHADGRIDSWDAQVTGTVRTLLLVDNTLYVGGDFTQIGGLAQPYLAAFNTQTGLLLNNWKPVMANSISRLAVSNNNVYALQGVGKQLDAVSLANGTIMLSITSDRKIYDIAISHNKLFLGGGFSSLTIGDEDIVPIDYFAAIDLNDHTLLPWQTPPNGRVESFTTTDDLLFVSGVFWPLTENENSSGWYMASFNIETSALINWAPKNKCGAYKSKIYAFGETIYAVCISSRGIEKHDLRDPSRIELLNMSQGSVFGFSQKQIYIGGYAPISKVRKKFAAVSKDGVLLDWAPIVNNNIKTLLLSENTLYLSGEFKVIDGQTRNYGAAFDVRDESLLNWEPEGFGSNTTSLIHLGDTIYAGGYSWLGAVDDVTGEASSWAPSIAGTVNDMETDGTTIYIGGNFTSINDSAQLRLAGLDLSGDTIWSPNVNFRIYDLTMAASTLYVSGQFSLFEESSRKGLALIDTSSMSLMSWEATPTYGRKIIINDDTLYSLGSSSLYAVNRSDGTLLWTVPINNYGSSASLVLIDDVLMINAKTTAGQSSYGTNGFSRVGTDGTVLD